MKQIVIIFGLLMFLVGILGGQAANNIFAEVVELEEQAGDADVRGFVSPEYISALYDEGSFVAFFSRALLFFSVSLFLYGFADDFQKLYNKQKGNKKESESSIKHEETYEEFKQRKKKSREEQRKSNN